MMEDEVSAEGSEGRDSRWRELVLYTLFNLSEKTCLRSIFPPNKSGSSPILHCCMCGYQHTEASSSLKLVYSSRSGLASNLSRARRHGSTSAKHRPPDDSGVLCQISSKSPRSAHQASFFSKSQSPPAQTWVQGSASLTPEAERDVSLVGNAMFGVTAAGHPGKFGSLSRSDRIDEQEARVDLLVISTRCIRADRTCEFRSPSPLLRDRRAVWLPGQQQPWAVHSARMECATENPLAFPIPKAMTGLDCLGVPMSFRSRELLHYCKEPLCERIAEAPCL